MRNAERVEGHVWEGIGRDGRKVYLYRRLVPEPFFENGVEKRRYRDIQRNLGPSLERALKQARELDREAEAMERGESPRGVVCLGQFAQEYLQGLRDTYEKSAEAAKVNPNVRLQHKAWRMEGYNVHQWLKHLDPNVPLDRVKTSDVEQVVTARRCEVSGFSAWTSFRSMRAMFNAAIAAGCLKVNPCEAMRKDLQKVPETVEKNIPGVEDVRRLLGHLKAGKRWLYQVVLILVSTGARLGEIVSDDGMNWGQLDFTGGTVTIRQGKTGHLLKMPLAGELYAELHTRWLELGMPSTGAVFLNERGRARKTGGTWRQFKAVARRVGLPSLTLKIFRSTAVTWASQGTGDPRAGQHLAGHSTLAVTERYYLAGKDEARGAAVAAIAARLAGPGTNTVPADIYPENRIGKQG